MRIDQIELIDAFSIDLLRPFGEYLLRRTPGVLLQLMINIEQSLPPGEDILDPP